MVLRLEVGVGVALVLIMMPHIIGKVRQGFERVYELFHHLEGVFIGTLVEQHRCYHGETILNLHSRAQRAGC
jgi:hypothetical protein